MVLLPLVPDDGLLKLDFSARTEYLNALCAQESGESAACLNNGLADASFTLSTAVATTAVESECLSKKVEEVEVELAMLRVRFAVDAVGGAALAKTLASVGAVGGDGGSATSDAVGFDDGCGGGDEEEDVDVMKERKKERKYKFWAF